MKVKHSAFLALKQELQDADRQHRQCCLDRLPLLKNLHLEKIA